MDRPSLQPYLQRSTQLDAWCRKQLHQLNQQEDSKKRCQGSCSGGWHVTNAASGHSDDADVGTAESSLLECKTGGAVGSSLRVQTSTEKAIPKRVQHVQTGLRD